MRSGRFATTWVQSPLSVVNLLYSKIVLGRKTSEYLKLISICWLYVFTQVCVVPSRHRDKLKFENELTYIFVYTNMCANYTNLVFNNKSAFLRDVFWSSSRVVQSSLRCLTLYAWDHGTTYYTLWHHKMCNKNTRRSEDERMLLCETRTGRWLKKLFVYWSIILYLYKNK